MSNYTKLVNYAVKDSLASGNPLKIISGTEIDADLSAIQTAVNSKADSFGATITNATLAGTLSISATTTITGALSVTGGGINNTAIGATTPSTGAFTTLSASGASSVRASLSVFNGSIDTNPYIVFDPVLQKITVNVTPASGAGVNMDFNGYQNDSGGINFRSTPSTLGTADTATPNGTVLGVVQGQAHNGTDYKNAGDIRFLRNANATNEGGTVQVRARSEAGAFISTIWDGVAQTITNNVPTVINVFSDTTPALRLNQTGIAPVLVVEDSVNPDTTPFTIDQLGNVVVGSLTPRTNLQSAEDGILTRTPRLSIEGTTFDTTNLAVIRNSLNTSGCQVTLGKSRGAAAGDLTAVGTADNLGSIVGAGADGTNLIAGASILFRTNGTVSTGIVPTQILLNTQPRTGGLVQEGLRVTERQMVHLSQGSTVTSLNALSLGADTYAARSLTLGTPKLDTAVYQNKVFPLNTLGTFHNALYVRADGLRAYTISSGASTVREYSLSTAYDITTATATNTLSVSAQAVNSWGGIDFKTDGTKFYAHSATTDVLYQYNCPTPWSLSGATYDNISFTLGVSSANNLVAITAPAGIRFSPDGLNFFVMDDNTNVIYWYIMSTAWDITTAVQQSATIALGSKGWSGFSFDTSGTRIFTTNTTDGLIETWRLAQPYNLEFSKKATETYNFAAVSGANNRSGEIHFVPAPAPFFYVTVQSSDATAGIYQFRIDEFPMTVYSDTTFFGKLVVPKMSTIVRDNLINLTDGMIIYNTTTNKFNFRENGAWVQPTVTAA